MTVSIKNIDLDLEKVFYIKIHKLDDRIIPLQPCYLGNSKWESWLPTEKGLFSLEMVNIHDGCYFSKSIAKDTDIHIRFISLIMKRAYFKELIHFEKGILEDINNLSASVSKINLFHTIWLENSNLVTRRFISTEIEYIFKVCRSLFDLLQEVIAKIWAKVKYSDPKLQSKKMQSTFSKMVYKSNKLSSSKEIESRYLIPTPLAQFYAKNGVFFNWLRLYRDKISHGGNSIEFIFILDEGFSISTEKEPFKGLNIWDKTELKNNKLGSVRVLVAYTILNTLDVLEDFDSVIKSIIQLPPDIAPDYEVFIRGENLSVLHELHKYIGDDAWLKYDKKEK